VRRRLLAAVAALLLLGVGTAVLVTWVNGAENRALAGVQTVRVLVADQVIPEGTPADQLADLVRVDVLPSKAALAGRVTDISALAGQLATVDLQPGEQLRSSRFARPDDLQAPGTVAVPEGMQEVSVLLEPQRAVGGRLAAGDTVGIFVSMAQADGQPASHAVLHDVLVTQVQGAPTPIDPAAAGEPETASAGAPAPSSSLMITFAVTAAQAEAVVYGVEHASLWLSLEPEGADIRGTAPVTAETIYGKAFS
jgi:pilus assembly protein CpaB